MLQPVNIILYMGLGIFSLTFGNGFYIQDSEVPVLSQDMLPGKFLKAFIKNLKTRKAVK